MCVILFCPLNFIEARGNVDALEMLGQDILEVGIAYMKANWRMWCQRISVADHLHDQFPRAIKGEQNSEEDWQFSAINCYDRFLKKDKSSSSGGSFRPVRPSTSTAVSTSMTRQVAAKSLSGLVSTNAVSTTPVTNEPPMAKKSSANLVSTAAGSSTTTIPVTNQQPMAKRSSAGLSMQVLDLDVQADTQGSHEGGMFRVPGWTRWVCTPEQQAAWKKEGEKMSANQLKEETEELQRELEIARNSQGTIQEALKSKMDLVCKLEAELSEFRALTDVKQSLQRKQEKLAEALGIQNSLEASDLAMGFFCRFLESRDFNQLLQEINSTRQRKWSMCLPICPIKLCMNAVLSIPNFWVPT